MLRRGISSLKISSLKSHQSLRLITRRNLLLLIGAGVTLFNLPRWARQTTAQNIATSPTGKNHPTATQQQNEFLVLSALLIGNQHLPAHTSAHTYAVLCNQFPQFQQHARALFQFAQTRRIRDVDTLLKALRGAEQAPLKSVLYQIIGAWYLGVVGDESQHKIITYQSALMFDQVRDVVTVPGYCSAAPGSWATQPSKKST